jgi:hypothetical protein
MLLLVVWPYGLRSKPSLLKRTCAFHLIALMIIIYIYKKRNFVNFLSGYFQLGMEKYLTSHS